MICKICEKEIPDISKYCMFCGSKRGMLDYTGLNDDLSSQSSVSIREYYDDTDIDTTGPKSKRTAGLLGVFLGAFGAHRFYLGYTKIAILQIVVSLLTCTLGGAIWGFIEGLMILCDTYITTDYDGNRLV